MSKRRKAKQLPIVHRSLPNSSYQRPVKNPRTVLIVSGRNKLVRFVERALSPAYAAISRKTPQDAMRHLRGSLNIAAICIDTTGVRELPDLVTRIGRIGYFPLFFVDTTRKGVLDDNYRTLGVKDEFFLPNQEDTLSDRVVQEIAEANQQRLSALRDPQVFDTTVAAFLYHTEMYNFLQSSGVSPKEKVDAARLQAINHAELIYRANPAGWRGKVVFGGETTEGGIVRLQPGFYAKYGAIMLKRLPTRRVDQVLKDTEHFKQDSEMPLESIIAGLIPPGEEEGGWGYLLKGYVPGPNVTDLLLSIKKLQEDADDIFAKKLVILRDDIVTAAVGRVLYWQKTAPDIPDENNCQRVVSFYEKNLPRAFSVFMARSDVSCPDSEAGHLNEALKACRFDDIIAQRTIRRNFAATYRNMVFRQSSDDEPALSSTIKDGMPDVKRLLKTGWDSESIEENIVHVDTHRKYSHQLEDIIELTDAYEADLSPEKRQAILTDAFHDDPASSKKELDNALPVIGFYRNMRKVYIFIDRFGNALSDRLKEGDISQREYDQKRTVYTVNVRHHLDLAAEWLSKLIDQRRKYLDDKHPLPNRALNGIKTMAPTDPDSIPPTEHSWSSILVENVEQYRNSRRAFGRQYRGAPQAVKDKVQDYIGLLFVQSTLTRMRGFNEIRYGGGNKNA